MALEFDSENGLYNQIDFFPPLKERMRKICQKEE